MAYISPSYHIIALTIFPNYVTPHSVWTPQFLIESVLELFSILDASSALTFYYVIFVDGLFLAQEMVQTLTT